MLSITKGIVSSSEELTLYEGIYGSFWGIIGGSTGIRLSKPNNLSRTQCLWKAFITLFFFTLVGSFAGFVINIIWISGGSNSVPFTIISYVEFVLLFGKDIFFYFRMIHVFSSFDRFLLGFLELRLFKMPT